MAKPQPSSAERGFAPTSKHAEDKDAPEAQAHPHDFGSVTAACAIPPAGDSGSRREALRPPALAADETHMDAAAGPLVRALHDLARGRPDRALAALDDVAGSELESEEFWRLRAYA